MSPTQDSPDPGQEEPIRRDPIADTPTTDDHTPDDRTAPPAPPGRAVRGQQLTRRSKLADAPDGVLLERATDGDQEAFDILIRRHAPSMRAYAARVIGRSTADDVLRDAVLAAWRTVDDVPPASDVRTWLISTTSRAAVAYLRTHPLAPAADPQVDGGDARAGGHDPGRPAAGNPTAAMGRAVAALPEHLRQCWALREFGRLPVPEIADLLRLDEATVRDRLAVARTTLVRQMEAWT